VPVCDTILLIGDYSRERLNLVQLCGCFRWRVRSIPSLSELRQCRMEAPSVLAVIFKIGDDPIATLASLRDLLPGARLIPSAPLANSHDWATLADAGAYHLFLEPFTEAEVRQGLGFLQADHGGWQSDSLRKPGPSLEQGDRKLLVRSQAV
jgi:hypothetical protein